MKEESIQLRIVLKVAVVSPKTQFHKRFGTVKRAVSQERIL